MTKHTPGPWCIDRTRQGRARYILPGTDPTAAWRSSPIAEILSFLPAEENEANAALIAAAPETAAERDQLKTVNAALRAALADVLYGLKWAADRGYVETLDVEKYLETGRTAIAKTRGETP